MKARIEHDPMRVTYRVWLYQPAGRDRLFVWQLQAGALPPAGSQTAYIGPQLGEFTWQLTEIDPGQEPPPSFELPDDGLRALVAEASDVLPPSAALERHLYDTIGMRDRLLAMVEESARSRLPRSRT